MPPKLQSALENILERRRDLANERGGDAATGEAPRKPSPSHPPAPQQLTPSTLRPPDSDPLGTVVSEAFVRFFVELIGHYQLFLVGEREDGYSSSSSSPAPCSFQREGFRKAIPSKTARRFLEVFMETQMFGCFIQEREHRRQAVRGNPPRPPIPGLDQL